MGAIKIEDIKQQLAEVGWEVVTPQYQNLKTEMEFKCPEGHSVYSTWGKMRTKQECPICAKNAYTQVFKELPQVPSKGKAYRVLALDQATHRTGYAIFDDKDLVYSGVFTASEGLEEVARYHQIKEWLINAVHNWKVDYVGLEGIQYQANQQMGVTTFETLAELKGVLKDTLYELKVPFRVCPTNTWRHAIGVKGRTRNEKKSSMQMLVKKWFGVTIDDDRADAIGIGKYLCDNIVKQPTILFGD
jgi:Holliday junction resolvasome RuvABC endonuclease subunit